MLYVLFGNRFGSLSIGWATCSFALAFVAIAWYAHPMEGGIEGAGDIATGALLARAVEPGAGGHARGEPGTLCLNCGTALVGSHCHQCGQHAHIHRSIGAIGHELLHGVVHFEGKLWRTLPLLIWHPGALTRRYITGERARFVSPMALFLFSIFTMFAVFQIMGIAPPAEIGGAGGSAVIEQNLARVTADRVALAQKRKEMATGSAERADATRELRELVDTEQTLRATLPIVSETSDLDGMHTGWSRLDHGIEKAKKNPGLMIYKLQANSYKFSWLLIPLSLPFLWSLFFWKRGVRMYDHAVFVTYSIAFMSLLFIVLTILSGIGVAQNTLIAAASIIAPIHIYRQLRGAYRSHRWSAALRTFILTIYIGVVFALFALALIALGLIG